MDISPVFLGLIVMLCWGVADVFTALFTRKSTILSAFLYAQLGMVILYALCAWKLAPWPVFSAQSVILLLIAGVLSTTGYLFFCKAMQLGPVSIASAVIGCTPIITVLLTIVFLGEKINGIQAGGIVLAVAGAVLTSLHIKDITSLSFSRMERAALYGGGAFLSWGVFYALIDKLTLSLGWLYPLFLAKVVSVILLAIYLFSQREMISTIGIPKSVWLIALLVIILEFIGHFAYGRGVYVEQSAIINPIAFSYPLVAVSLAHVMFKERLEKIQYLGMAMVLIGIILLAM